LLNEGARWRPSLSNADPAEGMFVVRAEFVASDGVRFEGYVSPDEDAHVSSTQPTIVTADGQVRFWFGGIPPTEDELEAGYRTLGKTAAEVFPVRFRALVGTRERAWRARYAPSCTTSRWGATRSSTRPSWTLGVVLA
jgi:hypothetical protein